MPEYAAKIVQLQKDLKEEREVLVAGMAESHQVAAAAVEEDEEEEEEEAEEKWDARALGALTRA